MRFHEHFHYLIYEKDGEVSYKVHELFENEDGSWRYSEKPIDFDSVELDVDDKIHIMKEAEDSVMLYHGDRFPEIYEPVMPEIPTSLKGKKNVDSDLPF